MTSTATQEGSTPDHDRTGGPAKARDSLGRLGGVVVEVPDPAATAAFLRDALRFHVEDRGYFWTASCAGDYGTNGQRAIVLRSGSELKLAEVTWEVSDGYDLDALEQRLAREKVASTRLPDGLSFCDPAGNPLAIIRASSRRVPKTHHDPLRPRRLGHVNLKAPQPGTVQSFYVDVLGMKLSEQIGDGLFFLRISDEHHNLGLRGGERGDLHHLGFEVEGWNVYQPILDTLAEMEIQLEYGPGRHRPGNNIFAYVRDPSSGLRLELFADMARIIDGTGYEPRRWEAGDRMTKTINRWGPTPPESFLA